MELVSIILSSLLALFGGGGWVANAIAHNQLEKAIDSAEELDIRIDNRPNYQIAGGKVDRLRVAGRGIKLNQSLRIAKAELETEAIALNLGELNTSSLSAMRESLKKPLVGAFSVVVTEADLKDALGSEALRASLEDVLNSAIANRAGASSISYELTSLAIELKEQNEIVLGVRLRRPIPRQSQPQELNLLLNLGLEAIKGKQIAVTKLEGTVNDRPISPRLLLGFAEGISDRLDLDRLQKQGILARLLQLEVTEDKITVVGFAKMETKAISVNSQELTTIVRK